MYLLLHQYNDFSAITFICTNIMILVHCGREEEGGFKEMKGDEWKGKEME